MTNSTRQSNLTHAQIDCVLCDIATTAMQINRLTSLLIEGCCQIEDEALLLSVKCMAQRIGWAADMAMDGSRPSIGPCFGGAEIWMMPPVFHDSERA